MSTLRPPLVLFGRKLIAAIQHIPRTLRLLSGLAVPVTKVKYLLSFENLHLTYAVRSTLTETTVAAFFAPTAAGSRETAIFKAVKKCVRGDRRLQRAPEAREADD
jgi:hypothetical protein